MKKLIIVAIISIIGSGCATTADTIKETYVSPNQYSHYNCDQIKEDLVEVQKNAVASYFNVNSEVMQAAILGGLGGGLNGDLVPTSNPASAAGQTAAGLSLLKGQYLALQEANKRKECNVTVDTIEEGVAKQKIELDKLAKVERAKLTYLGK